MQAEITTTQLFLAAAFPTVLSLAGLVVSIAGFVNNGARIADLTSTFNGRFADLNLRFSDFKSDVNILSARVDTLIGAVNDLDKRVTRIEDKLGIRP